MRNFNNQDLDKYEKMTKSVVEKVKRRVNFTHRIPQVKLSSLLGAALSSGLAYLAYRIYDYHKYREQRYIDLFLWKISISDRVQREDLWDKIMHLNFQNQELATQRYEKYLREDLGRVVQKIKEKKSYKNWQRKSRSWENQNEVVDKKQDKSKVCEIILSKTSKSKLNLGFLFKLHTKQYITTLLNNGEIAKKTLISPVTLFNVPFFSTKKQQTKKISRKTKLGDVVLTKARLELSSECEKINYWNIFVQSHANNKVPENFRPKESAETTDQTKSASESDISEPRNENSKKSRQEILFQCRKRVKLIEEELVNEIKETINQNWMTQEKEFE